MMPNQERKRVFLLRRQIMEMSDAELEFYLTTFEVVEIEALLENKRQRVIRADGPVTWLDHNLKPLPPTRNPSDTLVYLLPFPPYPKQEKQEA